MANEKRLIDAYALIEDIEKRYCKPCKAEGKDYCEVACRACWVDDMILEIDPAPTVDAVEVVHGKWMPQYDRCWIDGQRWKTGYYCSSCMGFNKAESNYCPNCGAKMDGERREGE